MRLVTPRVSSDLASQVADDPQVELHLRGFTEADLEGVALVFAATGDLEQDQQVARAASARGQWVNAADGSAEGTFLLPACVERGPVQVAVSTGGASPALAVRIRDEIEAAVGPEYGRAAEVLGALRQALPAGDRRMEAFAGLLDGGLVEALRRGDEERVRRLTEEAQRRAHAAAGGTGGGEGGG